MKLRGSVSVCYGIGGVQIGKIEVGKIFEIILNKNVQFKLTQKALYEIDDQNVVKLIPLK